MSISNKISALLKYYSLTEGQNKIQQGKPNFHCFLCNLNTMRDKICPRNDETIACAAAMMYEIVRHDLRNKCAVKVTKKHIIPVSSGFSCCSSLFMISLTPLAQSITISNSFVTLSLSCFPKKEKNKTKQPS